MTGVLWWRTVLRAGGCSGSDGRGLKGAGRGNESMVPIGNDAGRRVFFNRGNPGCIGLIAGSLQGFLGRVVDALPEWYDL